MILATLHRLSKPEPTVSAISDVLTPVSLRHFSENEVHAQRLAVKSSTSKRTPTPSGRVPSLREILLDMQSKSSSSESVKDDLPPELTQALTHNHPFYLVYPDSLVEARRGERAALRYAQVPPRRMYLTAATLVALPITLIDQWEREINKHCDVGLRVLSIRGTDPLPDAAELASSWDVSTAFMN